MKQSGHGQAKILSSEEVRLLFAEGFTTERDRALFAIALYCGCRISEALSVKVEDTSHSVLTLRKNNTKGQLGTRQIDIHPNLQVYLDAYTPVAKRGNDNLFPGRHGRGRLTRQAADQILGEACDLLGLEGVSTHSFRRTALTKMSDAGIPLRVIQEISGHRSLNELQRYLEVKPAQKKAAIDTLYF